MQNAEAMSGWLSRSHRVPARGSASRIPVLILNSDQAVCTAYSEPISLSTPAQVGPVTILDSYFVWTFDRLDHVHLCRQ